MIRTGLSKWCLNCGKWEFQCKCRAALFYCNPERFKVLIEERIRENADRILTNPIRRRK